MRIKEEFKKSGYFWRPSEPDRKLPGTLSISDGGHIELEVIGRFGGRIEVSLNADLNPIERIVGHIEKDGFVTLDDCYYKTLPLSLIGDISKSLIHVGKVFIGVRYDEGESPVFNTLTFSVEGIDEWVGISGISVEHHFEERTATISYQPPEDISLDLDNGMRLLITFHWTLPGAPIIKEARISQKTYFQLVSEEERELKEFTSVVHKITNFLCFAIDKTVSLDSMSATADNLRQDFGEGRTKKVSISIYYSSLPYSKDEPKIQQHDMLFGFGKIQSDVQEKIKNWMEAYEKVAPALDLYFLAKMGMQTYLEARFLALAQGLEAYHRRTSNQKQMDEAEFKELIDNLIDQCPQERKEWLKGKLQYGNEVSLRHRLKSLIELFKEIIGDQKKQKELINRIVNTRNYLTHYDLSLESKAAQGEDLWPLCLKMELLFQLHFLQLIGFTHEQIDAILANSISLKQKLKLP